MAKSGSGSMKMEEEKGGPHLAVDINGYRRREEEEDD